MPECVVKTVVKITEKNGLVGVGGPSILVLSDQLTAAIERLILYDNETTPWVY